MRNTLRKIRQDCVRFRIATHRGFVAFEHGCAMGYATCEFYNLHLILYFMSAGLIVSCMLMLVLSLFGQEISS